MSMAHKSPLRPRHQREYVVTDHAIARVKERFPGWSQLEGSLNTNLATIIQDAVANGERETFYQLSPLNVVETFWVVDIGYRLRTDFSMYALCFPTGEGSRPVIKTVLTAEMYNTNANSEANWSRKEEVMLARAALATPKDAAPQHTRARRAGDAKATLADVFPAGADETIHRVDPPRGPLPPSKINQLPRAAPQEPSKFFVVLEDRVHHCDETALAALLLTAAQKGVTAAVHRQGPPCTVNLSFGPHGMGVSVAEDLP